MGRRSSLHEHFVHVKTPIGSEQIEVGKSRTATTSLPDLRTRFPLRVDPLSAIFKLK